MKTLLDLILKSIVIIKDKIFYVLHPIQYIIILIGLKCVVFLVITF